MILQEAILQDKRNWVLYNVVVLFFLINTAQFEFVQNTKLLILQQRKYTGLVLLKSWRVEGFYTGRHFLLCYMYSYVVQSTVSIFFIRDNYK